MAQAGLQPLPACRIKATDFTSCKASGQGAEHPLGSIEAPDGQGVKSLAVHSIGVKLGLCARGTRSISF